MNYFITAIHTDSGKTLVSAIFCEALKADYWKPFQSGVPRDSDTVQKLITNQQTKIHPEGYFFSTPVSPHAAAKKEGIATSIQNLVLPTTQRDLIIEGAGGCLVPVNDEEFMIDVAIKFNAPVILVSNLYLGSINHSLLTYEALMKRNIRIEGIVFNGHSNPESERIILHHTKLPCLLRIRHEDEIHTTTILRYAQELIESWKK